MKKIIHITDTHVGHPDTHVVGLDPIARLRIVLEAVAANHSDADFCIVSGDLVDQGEIAEYRLLRHCLETFPLPYRLMLGNHDNRANFRAVFPDHCVDPNGFVQMCLTVGDWKLILLDTKDDHHPGLGKLCAHRRTWLDEQLRTIADHPALIFLHHPPASVCVPSFDAMLLTEGVDFLNQVKRFSNVRHMAFGHIHMKASGVLAGISFSTNRGTCHKIAPNFQGEVVDYVDAGPAYDVLLLGDDGSVIVHAMDPAGFNRLTAREYPTPDGIGIIELSACADLQKLV